MLSLSTVALHTFVIYLFLALMLRFANRRQLGQLTVIDLVIIITLGSAVETAMVNADTTLAAGLVSASVLMITNRALSLLFGRSKRLRHLAGSGPILLIHDGQFVEEHLRRMGLTHADVLEALREREQKDINTIRFAILEVDGEITVIPRPTLAPGGKPAPDVSGGSKKPAH